MFGDLDPPLQNEVLALYARLLPKWKVIGVGSDSLATKRGLLHCISRNVPKFVSLAKLRPDARQARPEPIGVLRPRPGFLASPR